MKFMKRLCKVVRRAFGFCGGIIVGLGIATTQLSYSPVEIQATVQTVPCEDQIVVADARFSSDGNREDFLPPVLSDRLMVVAQNTASSDEEDLEETIPDMLGTRQEEETPPVQVENSYEMRTVQEEAPKPRIIVFKERKLNYQLLTAPASGTQAYQQLTASNYNGDSRKRIQMEMSKFPRTLDRLVDESSILEHTFIVQRDRWLSHYAAEQGTTHQELAKLNNIEANSIYESEVLLSGSCCPELEEDRIPHKPSQRWWKMNSSPTRQRPEQLMPYLSAPEEVKARWKTAIENADVFSAHIPRGTYLEQSTYGLKNGGTGYENGVYGLWTTKVGDSWEPVESEQATIWLTETTGPEGLTYWALLRFEKCQNMAWMKYSLPVAQNIAIPAMETVCPHCEPPKVITVTERITVKEPAPAPKKEKEKWIQPLTSVTGTTGIGANSGYTVAGNNFFLGLRLQKSSWKIRGVLDTGVAWDSASGFTILEGPNNAFHLSLRPSVSLFGFTFSDQVNFRPTKGDVDTNTIAGSYTKEFAWLYTQVGFSDTDFYENERRPRSDFSNLWGKLGVTTLGNTLKFGLFFDALSKFENEEWGANYYMWKKAVPGLFIQLLGRNVHLDATYSYVEEHSLDKVDNIPGFDNVHRFGVHIGYTPDWVW